MYLITYWCGTALGGGYGHSVDSSPVDFLERAEKGRSGHAEIFIINVIPISEKEVERIDKNVKGCEICY